MFVQAITDKRCVIYKNGNRGFIRGDPDMVCTELHERRCNRSPKQDLHKIQNDGNISTSNGSRATDVSVIACKTRNN